MRNSWKRWLFCHWELVVIVGVAAALRVIYLNDVSYWFDESISLKFTEFSFPEMWHRLVYGDDHPPFYFLVLKLWRMAWGENIDAYRWLSVLCNLLTVIGVYFLVIESYRSLSPAKQPENLRFAAGLAALFVALSPLQITWAQQTRMYAMMPTLAVWSSYFLFRALSAETTSRKNWVLFTLLSLFQVYTHYFGLLIAVAQYLFGLGYLISQRLLKSNKCKKSSIEPVIFSGVVFYFGFLPWLLTFLDHHEMVVEKFPAPALTWKMASTRLGHTFDLQCGFQLAPEVGFFVAQVCFVIFLLLAIRKRPADYFFILVAFFPFIAAGIASVVSRNVFVPRYLVAAQMFVLIAMAVVVSDIPWKTFRWSLAVLLVAGMSLLTREQILTRAHYATLPGMKGAVAYLDSKREQGDVVIVCNPMLFTSIVLYAKDRDRLYTQGTPDRYPFYQGAGGMRDDEYISLDKINELSPQKIFTFDADRWHGGTWTVPISGNWEEKQRSRFIEFNADFIIREYERKVME